MVSLSRQQLTTLWLGLAFFVVAYIWDNLFSNERNFLRYKNTIEKKLHDTEREANLLLEDTAFHARILRGSNIGNRFEKDLEKVDSLRKKKLISVFLEIPLLFSGHKTIFCLKQKILDKFNPSKHTLLLCATRNLALSCAIITLKKLKVITTRQPL
ncbi:MAG: hypothetical protein HC817_07435 [Saprospiraceae bacterium]|nr:hypothetical protein [Saprospiraceae bacterium]